MKNIFRIIPSCCFVLLLMAYNSQAQNNLPAGSIVFTSYQSDQDLSNVDNGGTTSITDRFSIVVLREGGLAANTVIYFTDNGWNVSTGNFISGLSEGFIKWVVPAGGIAPGAQIYFISKYIDPVMSWGAYMDEAGATAAGTVTTESGNNYMELSTGGDQILVYQTGNPEGPAGNYNDNTRRFITAINANRENYTYPWYGDPAAGGHQSNMPPGLSTSGTSIDLNEIDNGKMQYSGTFAGCPANISSNIYDWNKWLKQDYPFAIGATANKTYTITPAPAASFTSDPTAVSACTGTPVTFSTVASNAASYQWQQSADATFTSGVSLTSTGVYSGTATNTLAISNNGTLGGQYFRVVATNSCGSSFSSKAALLSLNPITLATASLSRTQAVNTNNNLYLGNSCELITKVVPAGSNPLANTVTSKVWIENLVPSYAGQPFVARHYEIMPASNASTATGTVSLYFTQGEFNAFNIAPGSTLKLPTGPTDLPGMNNLRVARYIGSSSNGSGLPGSYTAGVTVIDPTSIIWSGTASRWIITFDATGFGGFIVQTAASALPVNLLAFNGRLVNDDTHLQWKTTSETNNDYFEIERSLDGQTFTAIGREAGINGVTTQTYNRVDAGAAKLNSPKLYYRLKIVSTTGEVEYSSIVTISVNTAGSPVVTVTPNPFTSQVNINLQLPAAAQVTLSLSDVTGKKLKSEYVNAAKGISTVSLTGLGNLMQGMYLLSIQYNGQTYTYKLVK